MALAKNLNMSAGFIDDTEDNAAHNLAGLTLDNGWEVLKKLEQGAHQSGSFFSVCYTVQKDGEIAFLKAFDFARFMLISRGESMIDIVNEMTTAFRYERDLSKHCKNHHVTKVAFVKDSGEISLNGYSFAIVPYLIFDLADGDVRNKIALSKSLDVAWRLKSIHDVAVGLKQLHMIEVTHQDIKPSNILVYDKSSKIGDLGRSICRTLEGPYNNAVFTGDLNYAPPEIMYKYYEDDWLKRVFATDCYLLGSLIVYYFSGVSMSALLQNNLSPDFRWNCWRGTFDELEPYLLDAFANAIKEFEDSIENEDLSKKLGVLVKYLCYPIPTKRGHPKNILSSGSNYTLERFISILDRLRRETEYTYRHGAA